MATDTQIREEVDAKIYDADNDPEWRGRKIFIDPEPVNEPYKVRRYFLTAGAFIYAEPFVKTKRGWVGEISDNPGHGQRLFYTAKGTWLLNEYTLEEAREGRRGLVERYPREYMEDSQDEYYIAAMDKGQWGFAVKEDHYRIIPGHEAEQWLAKCGFDLNGPDFRGISFSDTPKPRSYPGTDTETRPNKRQSNVLEI